MNTIVFFWIQIVMALLKAILPFSIKPPEPGVEPGERIAKAVINKVILLNKDDGETKLPDDPPSK